MLYFVHNVACRMRNDDAQQRLAYFAFNGCILIGILSGDFWRVFILMTDWYEDKMAMWNLLCGI